MHCVKKTRQNVGFETWIWRYGVTSQKANTHQQWPPCMSFDFNEFYRNFVRMLRTSPTSQPPNIVLLTCSIFYLYWKEKRVYDEITLVVIISGWINFSPDPQALLEVNQPDLTIAVVLNKAGTPPQGALTNFQGARSLTRPTK